jgi:type VI secretion system protein ImpA
MATLLEIVSKPISDDQPCGPDLEMNEDKAYWLTIGRIEPALPKSLEEYEKFQGRGMPIAEEIAALTGVLERSHDLKVLSLIARLRILAQNLDGFIDAVEAINYLVQNRWEQVHPQGDVDYRISLIEALEFMPDTGYPLRDAPLFVSPRLGKVSYRLHLLATGALSAHRLSDDEDDGADNDAPTSHDLSSAAKAAKLDDIVASRDKVLSLLSMIEGLETNFEENAGSPLRLKALKGLTSKILEFLTYCVGEKDPSLAAPTGPAPGLSMEEAAAQIVMAPAPGSVDSVAAVNAYLRGVEEYYARYEPSSPVRLYVAQCRALVGKSFGEAIELLLPELVSDANLPIGGDLRARLPIAHFSPLLAPASSSDEGDAAQSTERDDPDHSDADPDVADDAGEPDASEETYGASSRGQAREHLVLTRQAAIQSIEAVIGFYRQKEPSSPIPLLLGQARTFASEDFIGALRSVLPKGSFAVDD